MRVGGASREGSQGIRVPPRPGAAGWVTGSACAGLFLGLAELLVTAPVVWLPTPLALALIASCTALVMACAGAWTLVTRLPGTSLTRSAQGGAMLGPLFAVGGSGPLRLALLGREEPWSWLVAGLVGATLLVGVGLAGAFVTTRSERTRPASPALTWAGASLLLAGLGRTLHEDAGGAGWVALVSIPIGVALGGAGLLGLAPRGARASTSFGRLLVVLMLAAVTGPFWPWLFPWLLFDRSLPDVGSWPPNLLFIALESSEGLQQGVLEGVPIPTLELLGATGVSYPRLAPEPEVESLLRLPDGSSLAPQLQAAGYATAAILTVADPSFASKVGAEQTDDRPGGRRMLEEAGLWMAGAPLLLGPASALLSLLGQDRPLRSPEQLGADAARWILSWRTTRAPAPFLLVVDFRAPEARAEAVDAGMQTLLDRLDELQLDEVTIVVVAIEPRASEAGGPFRAVITPPFTWSRATRLEVASPIWGRALGLALLEIALSDGQRPVTLPGLPQPLSLPKPR